MRVVMNSDGYLCIVIPIIKHHELSSYKEIIECKSCSYVNMIYPHP